MKVYHYTQPNNYFDIKTKNILEPRHRLAPTQDFNILSSYALLEPHPESWTVNPYLPQAWNILKTRIGPLLLEISIDGLDQVFVIDKAHLAHFYNWGKGGLPLPQEYMHQSEAEAEGAIIQSKMPFDQYLRIQTNTPYLLPEVVITQPVPAKGRITVSKNQDYLLDYLHKIGSPIILNRNLRELEDLPEMLSWVTEYRRKMGENNEGLNMGFSL